MAGMRRLDKNVFAVDLKMHGSAFGTDDRNPARPGVFQQPLAFVKIENPCLRHSSRDGVGIPGSESIGDGREKLAPLAPEPLRFSELRCPAPSSSAKAIERRRANGHHSVSES